MSVSEANNLRAHIDEIHTTPLGCERIRRNLSLNDTDAVAWCTDKIMSADSDISRVGKNWYVAADGFVITINASSFTVITAHRSKPQ